MGRWGVINIYWTGGLGGFGIEDKNRGRERLFNRCIDVIPGVDENDARHMQVQVTTSKDRISILSVRDLLSRSENEIQASSAVSTLLHPIPFPSKRPSSGPDLLTTTQDTHRLQGIAGDSVTRLLSGMMILIY